MKRREFLALAGAPAFAQGAFAQSGSSQASKPDITLRISPVSLEIAPGHIIKTTGYNGSVPGPVLRVKEGQPVLIQGISCFRFAGGLIAEYREVFDTGIALAQLGFPGERIRRVLDKEAAAQNGSSAARAHLARFRNP